MEENKLFFTIDFVKDLLDQAYNSHDEVEMCVRLEEIIANFPEFYNSMSKKPTITAFFEV
ncbi:hypothetical protein ME801_14920 [Lactobacillus delbrueckii]|nr:hypothetical protein ME801_14920 [Lactobacillus delbrueckii]